MQGNSYKYYASYDTNIKGTGGSGTITQRTPPDRESLSDYLRQPFYPGTRVIPPTQPIMYDNKQKTKLELTKLHKSQKQRILKPTYTEFIVFVVCVFYVFCFC